MFVRLQVAKAVSQALNRSVNCLPGQRDVDNAIRTVGEASKKLLSDKVSPQGHENTHNVLFRQNITKYFPEYSLLYCCHLDGPVTSKVSKVTCIT